MAEVVAAFVKPAKGEAMRRVCALRLNACVGAEGDANASLRSTRQVLLLAQESARRVGLSPGALRENVCIAGVPIDQLPSGTVLRIGSALLRTTFPCDPCGLLRRYTDIAPARLKGTRGMLAVVIADGAAAAGDSVQDLGVHYPGLPRQWRDRISWFLSRLPDGVLTTYGDVAAAVGEPAGLARALPRLLADARYVHLPTRRVVTFQALVRSDGRGVDHHVGESAWPPTRWRYWELLYVPLSAMSREAGGGALDRAVRTAKLVESSSVSDATSG